MKPLTAREIRMLLEAIWTGAGWSGDREVATIQAKLSARLELAR